MLDQPDTTQLQLLRRLDAKLDRVVDDVQDMKFRMTGVEERLAAMDGSLSGLQRRIDRIEQRLDRIEKRFDFVESPR